MEEIYSFFRQHPLPYKYITFPYIDDPPTGRHPYHAFLVNKVIAELTARYFNKSGFPHVEDFNKKWNVSWGQQFDPPEYQRCLPWQKINHFAGAFLIGKKGELHKRMCSLKQRVPNIDFYPESYLSSDTTTLQQNWKNHKHWILKPIASSRGEGITIVDSSQSISIQPGYIVQEYIERPLLICNSQKFDIRLYVLVTSIYPLRIYLHDFGLARLATHKYGGELTDVCSHLTNVSLNRHDSSFNSAQQKLSLDEMFTIISKHGISREEIQRQFNEISAIAIISASTQILEYHQKYIKSRQTSFELFGIDILIDENRKCHLIEVNVSPSMSGKDSQLDYYQKSEIIAEMMNIGRVIDCDPKLNDPCPGISLYDDEYHKAIEQKVNPTDWMNPSFADIVNIRDFVEEKLTLKRFKRIFPKRKNLNNLLKCFERINKNDLAFVEWIKMSNEERKDAFVRGEKIYVETLDMIYKKLENMK
ncbi:Tubulin-tyrosine ligase family protein [Histomonas meleagridis]|uniref:Tubulin-tyrosine ligase family protein n=1 Tax=Histomonas meleagridis TaxID=135588 RepID=UPI00355A2A78|nr:Tubulin-tyrosine ligase family protein [Histomonas meleagridis]KAH0799343.1 Tubulin-tyrosine ligase family protein [Histomonas meleagridis]